MATILSFVALAEAREIVGGFFSIFGVDKNSAFVREAIIIWAVAFIYVLDFSVNVSKFFLPVRPISRLSD